MEIDLAERQVTLDRAQREKKTVEKELEKVLRERPEDGSRHSNALQQFQSRIGLAERARDELQLKLNTIATQCRQKEISWEQERMHSESHVAELERRLQSRDQECEQLRDERIKLLGDLDQTNRQARTAEQSREAMERKLAQEVATLQQQQAIKEKEFSHQLENSGDAHRQNTHELRQLLTAQRRIGAKWREESKALASKLEHTVSEMRAEMIRLKRRNEELTIQIESARTAQHESEQQVGDLQSVQSRLKRLLQDAESRADTASRQIATLLSRERQLLDERKVLHREVDRMHMQATHRRTDVTNRLVKQGTDFMTGFNHSTTRDPSYQATRLELDDPRLLDFELPTRSPALHLEDLTHPRHRTRRQDSEHLSHRDRVSSSEHLSAAAIDNE
ncbi:sodium channel and clathrin linker 1-like isoform X3 [Corticium candelabrum]|uniref:sodium channel and clathrin linker 1-like isoform X3 n=1 Tax=Corticium candelabrum TaxID=121492 RepID=UPI002E25EA9D|nr:sodium channel and clathrin linker 1-like isoform X3 [Corticium candelabrum]